MEAVDLGNSIFAFYLLAITLELALSRLKAVKAGYETRDTLAAFGMTLETS